MREKPLVLITHPLPDAWIKSLHKKFTVVIGPDNETGISPSLAWCFPEVEAILCLLCDRVGRETLQSMPRLKIVANLAAGIDNIDIEYCVSHQIQVGRTPDVLTEATADLTLALMLSVVRNLPEASRAARSAEWKMWHPAKWLGKDLHGLTLGIFGMGEIGKAVARRSIPFGLKVIYHNRKKYPSGALDFQATYVSFENLVKNSDILTIHAPLNEDTRNKFDAGVLRQMKADSILLNVGRGSIINKDDLFTALHDGWIRAAGLDVTDPEPLVPTHPLFSLHNCLILPHIGSATEETRAKMAQMAVLNIQAGISGKPLPYPA
jgi:glyoxylate reductase